MSAEIVSRSFGFLGDITSFAGALVLALNDAGEGDRKEEVDATEENLKKYPELRDLLIEFHGRILKKEGDAELASSKQASERARLGAWILAAGFVFLLASRLVDAMYAVSH